MAYVQPYQSQADLPSATETIVHTSRNVDLTTGRYTVDAQGNAEGDDDIAHLVKMATTDIAITDDVITPRTIQAAEQRIRIALQALVDAGDIVVNLIRWTHTPGGVDWQISYRNLGTGQTQTYTRSHTS